jgi:gamma-glutamyltranspeptidase/glutathione hydrolase
VRGTYRGFEIVTAPPTSSGGTQIVETLNILEGFDLRSLGFGNPQALHLMTEAMKIAWADRDAYMGDPDYAGKDPSYKYDVPPVSRLISKEYAAARRKEIDAAKAGRFTAGDFGRPAGATSGAGGDQSLNTTHVTAMDSDGTVVSMTQTLNGLFGSGVALPGQVPGGGMLLNNTMALMDPDPRPGYERANAIAPRKRMLSTMSPTIVLKDGTPFMALGTPGGTFISAAVLQGILNVIDHGMTIQQAVEAPRIWTMMYGELRLEEGIPNEVADVLKSMGHAIGRTRTVALGMNGVLYDARTHLIHGGACWREDGSAAAWSGGDALPPEHKYPPTWDRTPVGGLRPQ